MNEKRIARLESLLNQAFNLRSLEIEDQSHLHAGHAGAKDGKAHFRLMIVADEFAGLSPIKRHQLVYAAVGDMMNTDIHALIIDARPPGD
ncbi:MAG: BolA family transcriptional regulator [Gammaproteobacteria bacterium]|nr:MAG: BolA family transcriptional regulator [Gammaproteobacteria bacterium]